MSDLLDENLMAQARFECTSELFLAFHGLRIRVLADNDKILNVLRHYYTDLTETGGTASEQQRIYLVNKQLDTTRIDWTPVERKKVSPLGLKETYLDVPDGRWINKVRTGMVMFQSLTAPIAFGNLLENTPQIINFINNQYLNYQQRQGYLLGHAAAFNLNGCVTAIAASSGGGKSTLMLKALEAEQPRFLSNDRILFKPEGEQVRVLGVAKHPRVNPGTLLNSERLNSILPETERTRFAGLPQAQLWDIEQKYDVPITEAYGENKTALSGYLRNLVLLDWSLDSSKPAALDRVDIEATPEVLDGLRKSPGAFFQKSDGSFPSEQCQALEVYAGHLNGVQVWRLTGQIDFDRAIELLHAKGIL